MNAPSGTSSGHGWDAPTLEEMQALLPAYRFEAVLGRGGMGAVYQATQISLERPVAIKILPADLMADEDASFAERFKNEAQTMAKMSHPAIVSVYDFGQAPGGLLYIVMEFIDGTDVAQMLATQGPLPVEHALSIIAHVCDALDYAHQRGVIHRDIKPANILINREGEVKVADFGLAKATDASGPSYTQTNMAMGTPDFVAPEAFIEGIPLDGRADLYAIGVMLYQLLTGEIPRGCWKMPSEKGIADPRFDLIIEKAMQTDREARYQTAGGIRRDLDVILSQPMSRIPKAAPRAATPSGPVHVSRHSTSMPVADTKKNASAAPWLVTAALLLGLGAWVLMPGQPEEYPVATLPPPSPTVSSLAPQPIPVEPEEKPMADTTHEPSAPATPEHPKPEPPVAPLEGIDLIAQIDPKADAAKGNWRIDNGTLFGSTVPADRVEHIAILLPVESPPDSYDLSFELTRTKPGHALFFSMANSKGEAMRITMDGWSGNPDAPGESVISVLAKPFQNLQVHPAPRFAVGQRRLVTCQVRPDSLRCLLDGEVLVEEPRGLLPPDQLEQTPDFIDPATPAATFVVGVCGGEVTYHRIILNPVESDSPLTNAPNKPDGPMEPEEGTPVAASETQLLPDELADDPHLKALAAGFERRRQTDAEQPYLAARAALEKSYLTNGLGAARSAARQKGALAEVAAIDAEKERISNGLGVPPAGQESPPEALRILRQTFRQALAQHQRTRDDSTLPLYDIYLGALDQYVTKLTQEDHIQKALQVSTFRGEIAARAESLRQKLASTDAPNPMPEVTAAAPGETEEPSTPGSHEDLLKMSTWQRAAHWLISVGGSLVVRDENRNIDVKTEDDIPAGRFDIIRITLNNSPTPIPPAEFALLEGLGTLQEVWINVPGPTVDSFKFLQDNKDLKIVEIATTTGLGDGLIPHLAKAGKLESLTISGDTLFTGGTLDQAPFQSTLVHAHFLRTAFSDEGMAKLAAFPNLVNLNVISTPVTPEGIEHLRSLTQLTHLDLEGTSADDSCLDVLSTLKDLKYLNLELTSVSPQSLMKLTRLKDLESLRVRRGNPGVTDEVLTELQKELPLCRFQ